MNGLKYPQWQIPYQQALVELDLRKLALRIGLAEGAISSRLELIRTALDTVEEVQALRDAQNGLYGLKNEIVRSSASQTKITQSAGLSFLIN